MPESDSTGSRRLTPAPYPFVDDEGQPYADPRVLALEGHTDWPEGRRLVVADPVADDDDHPDDPESIARWIAATDAIPALEMTAEEEAEWQAARKAQRDLEKATFNERADEFRRMFE